MKKISIWLVASSLVLTQCTKKFEALNTDPNQQSPENFNAEYFLAASQNEYKGAITGYESGFLFQSGWTQIIAAAAGGYLGNLDKYIESANTFDYSGRAWNDCYRTAGFADAIIRKHKDDPEWVNIVGAATVMKVLALHYITDIYGDIPYTEALQGFDGKSLGVIFPKYDKQQDVYTGLLGELDAALTKLDPAKTKSSADLFYAGDVAKWKKFGYSLMLRMGMRLTKVDLNLAKTWVEKAYAGGVFASNADNALIIAQASTGHGNENVRVLTLPGDIVYIRWAKSFIDNLKANNDPRLSIISEVVDIAAANDIGVTPTTSDVTPANQNGLPNGYITDAGTYFVGNAPGYPGATPGGTSAAHILGKYSRPRRALYNNQDGPVFVQTYAEVLFMLAEAKFRGWAVGATSAEDYYQQGIAAALNTYATFGAAGNIPAGTITTYANAQALTAGQELRLINTQYWLLTGSILNFTEAWNNWRRSGFPVLNPATYTGQFATVIPRRQVYPTTEASANSANYQAGITGLTGGGDTWSSRVWWDK